MNGPRLTPRCGWHTFSQKLSRAARLAPHGQNDNQGRNRPRLVMRESGDYGLITHELLQAGKFSLHILDQYRWMSPTSWASLGVQSWQLKVDHQKQVP